MKKENMKSAIWDFEGRKKEGGGEVEEQWNKLREAAVETAKEVCGTLRLGKNKEEEAVANVRMNEKISKSEHRGWE